MGIRAGTTWAYIMKYCLLSSVPSAAIHLLYYSQTQGIKFSEVIAVGKTSDSNYLLSEYAEINGFNLHWVLDPNGKTCQDLLSCILPDVLVIMVSSIIKPHILEIPNIATVNTHAGILPRYRGVDCRHWAILEGGAVGVTCHIVDSGVDTGPILAQRTLAIETSDTVKMISERNYYMNKWQVLVDGLIRLKQNIDSLKPQEVSAGRQYFWMHQRMAGLVDELLMNRSQP